MSADEPEAEEVVDVFIAFDDPNHVATIDSGMLRKVPPRILDAPVGEIPQLLLAGSIAIRVLVDGLVKWWQEAKGITIFVERDPEDGTIVVRPEKLRNVRRMIVAHPNGTSSVFDSPADQEGDIAAAIKALTR